MKMSKVRPEGLGGWTEEKTIGSGGFGTVTLWKHEEHDSCVALKKCRISNEMTAMHKSRWAREIDIMLKLDHPNVVKAREVPQELTVLQEELPLLCMEYCSGGDLRKVLNQPASCCGLPEYQVRTLLHDVASGIEYLHQTRIIHRDLKPENIVLQRVDDKYIYKIIDLGYAKDLDQGSVCTSFVGTLQYLAPELFASERYTCTVDYWSFGILAFECIVGYRPFLPNVNPLQWHKEVVKKEDEHIYIYYNGRSEVQYSKHIPQPNYLCRTTKMYLEQWLRLMLMWNPRSRARGLKETPATARTPAQKRPRCFDMLDNILQLKLVFVLCVPTGQLLTYPVNETYSLAKLQLVLEQETKIPVAEQELLLASGIAPDPQKPAEQCCNAEMGDEEWLVFLSRKNSTTFSEQGRKTRAIPDAVHAMVQEPKTTLTYQDQRRVWGHAFYFVGEVAKDYRRLLQGQRAAMMSLLRGNSSFSKLKSKLQADFTQLQAQAEFFKHGLSYDINKYHDQSSQGVSSQKLQTSWKKMDEDSNRYLSMKDDVNSLDQQCHALSTRVVELQRSPFAKMKRIDILEDNELQAKQCYENLRQIPKEQRPLLSDNTPMVQAVKRCVANRDRLTHQLYLHLGKIATCKLELEGLNPKLDDLVAQINDASAKLLTLQHQRQNDMWTLLRVTLKQTQSLSQSAAQASTGRAAASGSTPSLTTSAPVSLPIGGGAQSVMASSIEGQSMGSPSLLSSMVEKSSMESLAVLNENQNIKNRLVQLMSNLQDEHKRSMTELHSLDWSFVSGQPGHSQTQQMIPQLASQPVSMQSQYGLAGQHQYFEHKPFLIQPQTYTGSSDSLYSTLTPIYGHSNQTQQEQAQQQQLSEVLQGQPRVPYRQQGYYKPEQPEQQYYTPRYTNTPPLISGSRPVSNVIQHQHSAASTPPQLSQSPVSWTMQQKPVNPQVAAQQMGTSPGRMASPSPPGGAAYAQTSRASPQLSVNAPALPIQTGNPQRSPQYFQNAQSSTAFAQKPQHAPIHIAYAGEHMTYAGQHPAYVEQVLQQQVQTQQGYYQQGVGGQVFPTQPVTAQTFVGMHLGSGTARKMPPKIPPRITSAAGSSS